MHQASEDAERLRSEPWRAIYKDSRWDVTQKAVLARDGWQCRAKLIDGTPGGTRCPETTDLQAHHQPSLKWLWENLRDPFDLDVLFTLCRLHHAQADVARRRSA